MHFVPSSIYETRNLMKRIKIGISVLLLILGITGCVKANNTNNSISDLNIEGDYSTIPHISIAPTTDQFILENYKFVIDTNEMTKNLTTLCESSRRFGTEGEEKAAIFLNQKLISYGYETEFQEFNVYSRNILDALHATSIAEYFQVDKDEFLGNGKNILTISSNNGKKDLY